MLASGDDTKTFTHKDGVISYQVTAMEVTVTVELNRSDDVNIETASKTETASNEPSYEITYQNARTYKNSIGTVWSQAIFEITNTGATPRIICFVRQSRDTGSGSNQVSQMKVHIE